MANYNRIIPVLLNKNGYLVRSRFFELHQNIGDFLQQTERYFEWDIDELIYINLGQFNEKNIVDFVKTISKKCTIPLTVGGKISNIFQVDKFIRNGADRVLINSGIFFNNQLASEISYKYGSQAIVASVDYKWIKGKPILHVENGKKNTNLDIYSWIKSCEKMGVGEILLYCIDRDGSGKGYDEKILNSKLAKTNLPIIICGGAGEDKHFLNILKKNKNINLASENFFYFKENSYRLLKKYLKNNTKKIR